MTRSIQSLLLENLVLKKKSDQQTKKNESKSESVSVKRRLRTADCRLRTRGKMQTEGKMQTAD